MWNTFSWASETSFWAERDGKRWNANKLVEQAGRQFWVKGLNANKVVEVFGWLA